MSLACRDGERHLEGHFCINTWWAESGDDISLPSSKTPSQRVIYTSVCSVWVSVPGCQLSTALPFFNKCHQSSSYTGLWKVGQRPHCVHPAAGEAALIWIVTWLVIRPPPPPLLFLRSEPSLCQSVVSHHSRMVAFPTLGVGFRINFRKTLGQCYVILLAQYQEQSPWHLFVD